MKTVLPLLLAVFISGCDQGPEAAAPETLVAKATPVQNAPKTSPMPIQPLAAAPVVPQTAPIPPLVNTQATTGTATATVSPAPEPPPAPSATGS